MSRLRSRKTNIIQQFPLNTTVTSKWLHVAIKKIIFCHEATKSISPGTSVHTCTANPLPQISYRRYILTMAAHTIWRGGHFDWQVGLPNSEMIHLRKTCVMTKIRCCKISDDVCLNFVRVERSGSAGKCMLAAGLHHETIQRRIFHYWMIEGRPYIQYTRT